MGIKTPGVGIKVAGVRIKVAGVGIKSQVDKKEIQTLQRNLALQWI